MEVTLIRQRRQVPSVNMTLAKETIQVPQLRSVPPSVKVTLVRQTRHAPSVQMTLAKETRQIPQLRSVPV